MTGDAPQERGRPAGAGDDRRPTPGAAGGDSADASGDGGGRTPGAAAGPWARARSLPAPQGGWTGLLVSALPSTVLPPAAQAFGLVGGVLCGLAVAGACAALLAVRRRSLRPVVGGIVGVAVSGVLAWKTGSMADGFLVDVWYPMVASVLLTASVLVGRPLVGVAWSAARRRGADWVRNPGVRCAFTIATAALATAGGARFAVQHWLYDAGEVGWMAVTRIGLGLPLTGAALLVAAWAVGRAELRLR